MLLAREGKVRVRQPVGTQSGDDDLCLGGWNDGVFEPLQKDHRAGDVPYVLNGRALAVDGGALGIRADQAVKIVRFELVRAAAREQLEVGKAEVGGAGGEEAVPRQRVESGVAAGAATLHGDPLRDPRRRVR